MTAVFAERADRPHYVYRIFDADDQLLYIGCTEDVQTRLYHLKAMCNLGKSPNGELARRGIARVDVEKFPNRATAFAAERAAIRAENPLLNKQSKAAADNRLTKTPSRRSASSRDPIPPIAFAGRVTKSAPRGVGRSRKSQHRRKARP